MNTKWYEAEEIKKHLVTALVKAKSAGTAREIQKENGRHVFINTFGEYKMLNEENAVVSFAVEGSPLKAYGFIIQTLEHKMFGDTQKVLKINLVSHKKTIKIKL